MLALELRPPRKLVLAARGVEFLADFEVFGLELLPLGEIPRSLCR